MNQLNEYFIAIKRAATAGDGDALKELLRVDGPATERALAARASVGAAAARSAANSRLPPPWGSVVTAHLTAAAHLSEGGGGSGGSGGGSGLDAAAAAYNAESSAHMLLVDAINNDPEDTFLACAFERCMSNARALAGAADAAAAARGAKGGKVELCGSQLQQAVSRMGLPKGDASTTAGKRRAHLALVCMLLRVYFRLNNIQGCTQVARTVANLYGRRGSDEIDLREFPALHRVTFFYFLGRTDLYNENVALAARRLGDALAATRADAAAHRRAILRYLVPCKMLLGELPSPRLLADNGLTEYAEIAAAVRAGDAGLFARALAAQQARLVRVGLYLLVDKLQVAVHRRLIKRCAAANRALRGAERAHQVPLALVAGALAAQGVPMEPDELECVVANLIVRDAVKGYIAHKQKVLVVSKDAAFPPPSASWWQDPF